MSQVHDLSESYGEGNMSTITVLPSSSAGVSTSGTDRYVSATNSHEIWGELRSSLPSSNTTDIIDIMQDVSMNPNGGDSPARGQKEMQDLVGSQLPTLAPGVADYAPNNAVSTISRSTSRTRMLQLEAEIRSLRAQIQQLTSTATSRRTPAFDEMLQSMASIREEMEELRRRQSFGVESLPSYSRVG